MNTDNNMPSTIKSNRKASKPLMEKRRRARINRSLAELKDLIVCTTSQENENCRRSKLEKADILEMTVRHLHQLHEHVKGLRDSEMITESINPSTLDKFRAGFNECVKEVNRYLNGSESKLDNCSHRHLTNHLNSCLERFHIPSGWSQDDRSSKKLSSQITSPPTPPPTSSAHCEQDNNSSRENISTTKPCELFYGSQHQFDDECSLPSHHHSLNVHHQRQIVGHDKASTGQHPHVLPDKIVVMLPNAPAPMEMSVWRPW